MSVTLVVTADDINKGVQGDSKKCALALALKRCTGNSDASVGYWHAYAGGITYSLTNGSIAFHKWFDVDKTKVNPTTFTLREKI